jgi:hypothetical protein
LSHSDASFENTRQRPVRFHARSRALLLHDQRQRFGNAGALFLATANNIQEINISKGNHVKSNLFGNKLGEKKVFQK